MATKWKSSVHDDRPVQVLQKQMLQQQQIQQQS